MSLGACSAPAPSTEPDSPTPWSDLPAITTTVTAGTAPAPAPGSVPADGCSIAEVVDHAPVRLKGAQLLTVGVSTVDDAARLVGEQHIGGIFLGTEAIGPILGSDAIPHLVSGAGLPVSVAIDQEGGRVDRMSALDPPIPSARTMSSTMSVDEVRSLARGLGERLRGLGVTVDFAPSVDVSDQPDWAVIGDRSFSPDPQTVTAYGDAFAEGLRQSGITPVFKHFPGHGHSTGDSHLGSVWIPPLESTADLDPFRALLGRYDSAVMVGHMHVPGLAEELPASLSPAVYRTLRTGELGTTPFDGVVYTDDLSGMRAVSDAFPLPDAVLAALRAGADAPLFISTGEVGAVLDRVVAAVESGEYPLGELDASLARVLRSRGCGA